MSDLLDVCSLPWSERAHSVEQLFPRAPPDSVHAPPNPARVPPVVPIAACAGELAVVATYRPLVGGSGAAAGGSSGHDLAAAAGMAGGDGVQRGAMAPMASVMVFLVDLQVCDVMYPGWRV